MRVIVVDNPFVAMMLEMLFTGKPVGGEGGGGTPITARVEAPDLKANPDFYTKPEVEKMLVLKVKSNTTYGKMYDVTKDHAGNLYCTCAGFKYRGTCSHVKKVLQLDFMRGLGLCVNCVNFTRDERDLTGRGNAGCRHEHTIVCPPGNGCRYFKSVMGFKVEPEECVMPMVFPVEGTLLQTFQSRHFPEVQYEVRLNAGDLVCTCRGFNFHGTCKHVQYMRQRVNQGTIRI